MKKNKTRRYGSLCEFDSAERFTGKITAIVEPFLIENIPEQEWLSFQDKIAECVREVTQAHISGISRTAAGT